MKPYTYLIGWSKLDKYYYGVRYAAKCDPNDLMKSYFTSSRMVQSMIDEYGIPDVILVRKVFKSDESERAKLWEIKVLRRLGVPNNSKMINQHYCYGPPRMAGINNPFTLEHVRKKLSEYRKNNPMSEKSLEKMGRTKTIQNIVRFFRKKLYNEERYIKKCKIKMYEKYIDILNSSQKPYIRMIKKLKETLDKCKSIQPKKYPKNRKKSKRGKCPNISKSRIGRIWVNNVETGENKLLERGNHEIPNGWILGMNKKRDCNHSNSEESRLKISESQKRCRHNESDEKKAQRVSKWRETMQSRYWSQTNREKESSRSDSK